MFHWIFTSYRLLRYPLIGMKVFKGQKRLILPCLQGLTAKRLATHTSPSSIVTELAFMSDKVQEYLSNAADEYQRILKTFNEADASEEKDLKPLTDRLLQLKPLAERVQLYNSKKREMLELDRLLNDKTTDSELRKMAQEDKKMYETNAKELEERIMDLLVPSEPTTYNDIILEVTAGVGGQEAMLFAKELFQMYVNYVTWKGWPYHIVEHQESDIGGLRQASMSVDGSDAYDYLKFESGVHRVQRIPQTEKSGRIHTSTAAVAVLPQPPNITEDINMKDVKVETKRSSGAGGQHVNKTESAVRITHIPSGIVVECQTERSQIQNRATAMKKLRAKLYQAHYETQLNKQQLSRKIQIGTSGRSEKIRTYNFTQDRITDHRLGQNLHHLIEFMQGTESLDVLIKCLAAELKKEILVETIKNLGP